MPYVALAPATREARRAASAARWTVVSAARPDLQRAIALQFQLIDVLAELSDTLEHRRPPRLSLLPRYVAAKLARGLPAFAGEPIPVPIELLAPGFHRLGEVLRAGGAGEAAEHICAVVRERRMDAGSLLSASIGRHQQAIRTAAQAHGLAPDLLWLMAELAVSPYAFLLQHNIVAPQPGGSRAEALERGLDAWAHGYCPVCGSWPALAEVIGQPRLLRCSFCAMAWSPPPEVCLYCEAKDAAPRRLTPDGERPSRYVEVCDACRSYLKALPVEALSPFPLVSIGDLETTDLDMMAIELGYTRPSLREFTQHR